MNWVRIISVLGIILCIFSCRRAFTFNNDRDLQEAARVVAAGFIDQQPESVTNITLPKDDLYALVGAWRSSYVHRHVEPVATMGLSVAGLLLFGITFIVGKKSARKKGEVP